MGVIAEGIPRGCQGLFPPVFLGHPLSVFNKNSTLTKRDCHEIWNINIYPRQKVHCWA